jgi:hypothetical protein
MTLPGRRVPSRLYWLALLAVLLVGFALRVYRADHQEIWGDESAKLAVVNQGVAYLYDPGAEVHPRFFHTWLFVWYHLFGYNVFGLRMLSVLFGMLGLPLLYVLARDLSSSSAVGLAACFALALSPFHIAYSQDLTMYALLFVMVTLSFYALARALRGRGPRWRTWGLYVTTSILMLHTHYYAAFALAAQNLFVVSAYWREWRRLAGWIVVQGLVAAGIVPWFLVHYPRFAGQAVRQGEDLTLKHLSEVLTQGGLAFTVGTTFPAAYAWVALGYAMLIIAAVVLLLRRPQMRWAGGLLGLWLVVPPLCVWAFDYVLQHFSERFLSVSLPPLLILLGWAVVNLPWRRLSAPAVLAVYALTSAIAVRAWYFDSAFLKSDYGELMAFIERSARPGDVLLLDNPVQELLFRIYQPTGLDYQLVSPGAISSDAEAEREFPEWVAGRQRAWLVVYGAPETYDAAHRAELWLSRHGYKAFFRSYRGSYVTLYALGGATDAAFTSLDAQFINGPKLIGYTFEPTTLLPGGTLYLTLQWQATEPMNTDYTVFTHLWDSEGLPVAQSDSQPVSGTRPTSSWMQGEVITDRYGLLVPDTLASGDYTLQIGLYDLASLNRLTLAQPDPSGATPDHVFLGVVHVTR